MFELLLLDYIENECIHIIIVLLLLFIGTYRHLKLKRSLATKNKSCISHPVIKDFVQLMKF